MKKLNLTLALLLFSAMNFTFAQENSFSENGNVGIGTTTPNAKLDVHGRVNIDSTLVVKDSVTIEKSMTIQEDMRIEGESRFADVYVEGLLDVSGTATFNENVYMPYLTTVSGLSDNDHFVTYDENGKLTKHNSGTLKSTFVEAVYQPKECPIGDVPAPKWYNGLNKLYTPCPPVKVGIGTTTPLAKLDVRGDVYCTKFAMNVDPTTLGTEFFHMKITSALPQYGQATVMVIENNERRLFQLNNDGAVRTREVFVDAQTAWPDYVFEEDYKLPDLKEVASFVEKNKHLPDVPSAKEVEENGINVGEMNKILLEKVEQLTLYLIEQEQRIETLEQEIDALKK